MTTAPTAAVLTSVAKPSGGVKHRSRRDLFRQDPDADRDDICRNIRALWAAADSPLRHRDAAFALVDGYDGNAPSASPWLAQLHVLSEKIGSGFIVVLHGPRGTGKTQLGVNVIREACIDQRPALYTVAMSMFFALRATFKPEGRTEESVIADYTAPKLLVVDEIHERGETEWEDRTLAYILNQRYDRGLDTVLITNELPEACVQSLGPSIADRIRECGWTISCDWGSFRVTA